MNIEHYQGTGLMGPFGYCRGVFIQWLVNDKNELGFDLEEDPSYGDHDRADREKLELSLKDWIASESEKPNPIVLKRIRKELKRERQVDPERDGY